MALMKVRGEGLIEILPIGTLICDRDYPELTGTITGYEYHESGELSAIPYKIKWDDEDRAHKLRGMVYWWATSNGVTRRNPEATNAAPTVEPVDTTDE